MKKIAAIILSVFFLLALALLFLPIEAPFLSEILQYKINEKLHGNVSIRSSSITGLRKIHVKGLKFTPAKNGVPFYCDEITIKYNILGSLLDRKGERTEIKIKNMYLDSSNSMLSGFSDLLVSKDNHPVPLFDELTLQSSKQDKDVYKNVISARGLDLQLKGNGTETKNGNVIDYNLNIILLNGKADKFRSFFAMSRPKENDHNLLTILLLVQGQPNSPFVTISCDQLKLNFRVTNKK